MKKVFFLTNKAGDSVFGAITESHGQLPAFFTDETAASTFFTSNWTFAIFQTALEK